MEVFLESIIAMISFFDYWIEDAINNSRKIKKIFLQFIFIMLFSSTISLVIILFLSIVLSNTQLAEEEINSKNLILLSSILMMFIFFLIEYLNRKDSLNLPRKLINYLLIIISLKREKKGFRFIEFFIFNSIAILGFWGLIYLIISNISVDLAGNSLLIALGISMIVSFFIYSELTSNKLERLSRQVILWLSIFVLLLALTFASLDRGFQQNTTIDFINIGLMLFGLIYNIATIADKIRAFFDTSQEEFKDVIDKIISEWHEKYSYRHQIQNATYEFTDVWKSSGLKQKVIIVSISLFSTLYVIFIAYLAIGYFKQY